MLSEEFVKEMEAGLHAEKDRLEEELKGLSAHTEVGDSLEDNAEEFSVDAANQDVISRIRHDLQKIEFALGKIANGSYGTDAEGNEISEERLRVLPWADTAL